MRECGAPDAPHDVAVRRAPEPLGGWTIDTPSRGGSHSAPRRCAPRRSVLAVVAGLTLGLLAASGLAPGTWPTADGGTAAGATAVATGGTAAGGTAAAASPTSAAGARPNIVVIYLDDMRASDLRVMPTVKRRIAARGVSFTNAVVSTSACCPARATHLSGRYAHNTGVLHNSPPFGGYGAFRRGVQAEGATLPVWLQDAGYRTVFFGKFMNHYPDPSAPGEVPPGFSDWYGLYEGSFRGTPYTIYRQTRYVVRVRPDAGRSPLLPPTRARRIEPAPAGAAGHLFEFAGGDAHQTEVLMDGAVRAVRGHDGVTPLYLNVWLTAPHTGGDGAVVGGGAYGRRARPFTTRPADPELHRLRRRLERGAGLGPLSLRRPRSFNERDVRDKPQMLRPRRLDRRALRDLEIRNALRLAALQSVDRKIGALLDAIDASDARTGRDTYVVFSSDGGYFLGEHRLPYEKNWHYGAATDVPLIVRGPRVRHGAQVAVPVGNIDLAPTLLDLAAVPRARIDGGVDGRSLLPLLRRSAVAARGLSWERRTLLLEGFHGRTRQRRYAGVRNRRYVYVEHHARAGGRVTFRELYDLRRDPSYERNLLHGEVPPRTRRLARTLARALDELAACAGHECRRAARVRAAVDHTVGQPLAGDATGPKSTTRSPMANE